MDCFLHSAAILYPGEESILIITHVTLPFENIVERIEPVPNQNGRFVCLRCTYSHQIAVMFQGQAIFVEKPVDVRIGYVIDTLAMETGAGVLVKRGAWSVLSRHIKPLVAGFAVEPGIFVGVERKQIVHKLLYEGIICAFGR